MGGCLLISLNVFGQKEGVSPNLEGVSSNIPPIHIYISKYVSTVEVEGGGKWEVSGKRSLRLT